MSFRIDLHDPVTGLKTGKVPISSATQIQENVKLDRIGTWTIPFSVTDPALKEIKGKDIVIYWAHQSKLYRLGGGSYLNHHINADGRTVQLKAAGTLRDLQRQTVLQKDFDGASDDINNALSYIISQRAGWSLGGVDTMPQPAPLSFWYESIFDSVAILAETFGKHFRGGINPKTLDFGAFGVNSGVIAIGGERELSPDVYHNNKVVQIKTLGVDYKGDSVINRLIPFGGAVGVAAITLKETTVTQPNYPVKSAALPGGGSFYYIEDESSINTYGLTERRFIRQDLRPITNSQAAREFGSNVLYEATLASLLNLKDEQTIYSLSVTGLKPGLVRVGDKIRVRWRGVAETPIGEQVWLDLDDDFYILEQNITYGANGVETSLKINLNAVSEQSEADLIASTIKRFEQSQIVVQPTISRYTVGPYTKRVNNSPSVKARFSFQLGPETLDIWYVKIKVSGEPLKSSIESVASEAVTTPAGGGGTTPSGGGGTTPSGGGSTTPSGGGGTTPAIGSHVHAQSVTEVDYTAGLEPLYYDPNVNPPRLAYIGSQVNQEFIDSTDTVDNHTHDTPNHQHTVPNHQHTVPNHEHTIPNHQHSFTPEITATYGIFEDTVRPDNLTIRVNGSVIASGVALTGPDYDYEDDITDHILAAANLQQEHIIEIETGSNRGEIQFQAQVLAIIQGITIP